MHPFKIAVAQVPSIKGDVATNIKTHIKAIEQAGKRSVSILIFPELSLTGYEPELGQELAFTKEDHRLLPLIEATKNHQLTIVVGAPAVASPMPEIGAIIITPEGSVSIYSKMHLHPGEEKFFQPGNSHCVLDIADEKVGIAICADTNNPTHPQGCKKAGATIYVVGILSPEISYPKDSEKLAKYAKEHQLLVAMANHNGPTGGWTPAGKSGFWSPTGQLAIAGAKHNTLVTAEKTTNGWQTEVIELT